MAAKEEIPLQTFHWLYFLYNFLIFLQIKKFCHTSNLSFVKDYSMCEAHLVFFKSFAFEKKLKFTKENTLANFVAYIIFFVSFP